MRVSDMILEPRGTLLCVQHSGVHAAAGIRQLVAAILCGNSVVHVATYAFDLTTLMEQVGLGKIYTRVALMASESLEALVVAPALDGVAVSAPESLVCWIDGVLAKRAGPLLPLIVETTGPGLMPRFVIEKAVSNNTTASGGNASLLAMGDS